MDKTMEQRDERFASLSAFSSSYQREHYWTYEEVKAEVESVAEQFKSREI
jgi:hypothetical protein